MGDEPGTMKEIPLDEEAKKSRQWIILMQKFDKLENHLYDQLEQQKGTNALLLQIRDELKEARQP